jgi:aspartate ammonia-lyase
VGRTHLQDATPITLGQEIGSWVAQLDAAIEDVRRAVPGLTELAIGGTAIGTGLNAHPRFGEVAAEKIAIETGRTFVSAPNKFAALSAHEAMLTASASLRTLGGALMKIANDVRWLASGPRAGLGELLIPENEPGSSIMPGKVNPVIPEVVNEVAFAVAGGDVTLTMAAEAGQLQLNAFEPVMAHVLFENLKWMTAAMATLRVNCITGITVNSERLAQQIASFVAVITALIPHIGYGPAAKLAKEALATNANIADLVVKSGLLSRDQITELMSPERLTSNL